MNRLALALLLLFAACGAPIAPPAPVAKPAATISAPPAVEALLAEVNATYANATSYSDTGVVVGDKMTKVEFSTRFVRPDRLRFEYKRAPSTDVVIWTEGTRAFSTYSPAGLAEAPIESLLGASISHSSAATYLIPSELLARQFNGAVFAHLPGAKLAGDDTLDGHRCWRVTVTEGRDDTTLWIDATSHLLRRIGSVTHVVDANGQVSDAKQTIDYMPQLDVPIADADLAGPPGDRPQHLVTPWVGVQIDLKVPRVNMVIPGAPADKGGVLAGDELVALDGVPLSDPGDLPKRVRAAKVGDHVTLRVRRAGKEIDLALVLEEKKAVEDIRTATLMDHKAPPFAATRLNGTNPTRLADLAGHVVVVDFWATWCGPCRMTFPHLDALNTKYKDLRIVGLTTEDVADVQSFLKDTPLGYTLARDDDADAWRHYFVTAIPMLVVIDKTGTIRDVEVGVGDFDALEAELVKLMASK